MERAIGHAVVLHEHEIPNFNHLGVVLVDHLRTGDLGAFGIRAQVDVDFRAGTARTGFAHFPEVVVLIAVDDMVFGQMLEPETGCFVVAREAFGFGAFKHGGVQAFGV